MCRKQRRFPSRAPCRIVPVVLVHLIDGTFELFRYFLSPAAAFDRSAPGALRAVRSEGNTKRPFSDVPAHPQGVTARASGWLLPPAPGTELKLGEGRGELQP